MLSSSRAWIVLGLMVAVFVGCGDPLPPPRRSPTASPTSQEDNPNPNPQAVASANQAPETADPKAQPDNGGTSGSANSGTQSTNPGTSPAKAGLAGLSPQQRYERSVSNLKQIGEAIGKYVEENGHYPHQDMHGKRGMYKMQSWRVALLPYLGESALFQQCDTKEYWKAPENRHMLGRIPDVYKSNAKDATKCNICWWLDGAPVLRRK